jgi:hypothetical protein
MYSNKYVAKCISEHPILAPDSLDPYIEMGKVMSEIEFVYAKGYDTNGVAFFRVRWVGYNEFVTFFCS